MSTKCMGQAHLDLPPISAPATTSKRSNGIKKAFSPSNFIVKHAKVHRYQIEKDNMEVKALFSYLSQIYRAGCDGGEVASDYRIHYGNGDSHEVPSESHGSKYPTNYLLPITSSKIETRKGNSTSSADALRNYYFSSCSISSTSPEKPRVHMEVPFPFIDNWIGSGDKSENVSQSPFLMSLKESGFLPLQILLGSIPGVDTSNNDLPLISPFMAAMSYLESIGMGFYGMKFSGATPPVCEESSIVSSDAISSEIEGQGDREIPLESELCLNKVHVPPASGPTYSLHATEMCRGSGEMNFDSHRNCLSVTSEGYEDNEKSSNDSDFYDTSNDGHAIKCSNDDGDNISSSGVGTSVPQYSGRSSGNSGSIVSENDIGLMTSTLTDSMLSCENMPPTHVIVAAFNFIVSREKPSSDLPTTFSDPRHYGCSSDFPLMLSENLSSGSSIARGSQSPPSSMTDMAPSLPQSASSSTHDRESLLNSSSGIADISSATASFLSDPHISLDPPRSEGISNISNISSLSCSGTDSSTDLDRLDGSLIPSVPPFFLSTLATSDIELADLTNRYNLQVELDSIGRSKLSSIESTLKYFDQIASSGSQKTSTDGCEDLVLDSRSEECSMAADALRSFSETLQLSTRISDLKSYPLWGPVSIPAVPPFDRKYGTVEQCETPSSNSTECRPEDCPERDIILFGEMLRDQISSSSACKVGSPCHQTNRQHESPRIISKATPLVAGDNLRAAPSASSCAFNAHHDFMNLSDTSGAVALLALMSDCVCSSEFDCYFDNLTSFTGPRKREREEGLTEAKKRKSGVEEIHGEQLTSRRQQRCPKCGEFKKGHICRFLREVEPVSPRSDF